MLMPDPAVLRDLLDRYGSARRAVDTGVDSPTARRRLEDVSYTLCVATGTCHIDDALSAAGDRLTVRDDAALSAPA